MIPSQSTLRAYDVSHLTEHAAHWRELAARRRSVMGTINAQANSLDWQGQGDAAMKAAMARHLSTAEDEAGLLDAAAQTAEGGASVLHQQQQSILSGVHSARQSGFAVGEDWSVTDTMYPPGSMGWYARQPTAQAIAADLRTQAATFTTQEFQTATEVATAAGDLGGQGAVHGHIRAIQAAAITTPAQNATTAPSTPPAAAAPPINIDALTGADRLIRQLSPPQVSSPAAPVWPAPAGGAISGIGTRLSPPPVGGVLPGAGSGGGAGVASAGLAGSAAGLGGGIPAMATQVSTGAISTTSNAIATPAALGAAWTAAVVPASPVAHSQSHPLPPTPPPPVQLVDPGQAQHEHAPQPATSTDAPQASQPPAAQSTTPTPAPVAPASTGVTTPSDTAPTPGTSGGGVQMLGFGPPGLGPAPQAPSFPLPRDPTPAPPPPPVPKNMTPEQVRETYATMTTEELRALYEDLKSGYHDRCLTHTFILPQEQAVYSSCLAELGTLNSFVTELRARGVEILPPGAEPAPGPTTPQPGAPGTQPQPGAPTGPSIAEQATQIAQELRALPEDVSRSAALADKVTALHLSQEQAAEVTDIASKALFPATGGIVNGPDGTMLVLPANILQRIAMMVHPDGSVTVFRGDLTPFIPK